jgi:translation initiation factor 2 gamma subunit (eIF-2gamma)
MNMKKEDVIFDRKEFLNLAGHNGQANVVANIVNWTNKYNDKLERNVDIKLDFADCSRVVNMDFDIGDEYARENSIHKVDVLLDVLKDFRKVLIKECKTQERLEVKRAKKEKD